MERVCELDGLMVHNAFVYLFTNIPTMATVLTKKNSIQKTAKYYFQIKTTLLRKLIIQNYIISFKTSVCDLLSKEKVHSPYFPTWFVHTILTVRNTYSRISVKQLIIWGYVIGESLFTLKRYLTYVLGIHKRFYCRVFTLFSWKHSYSLFGIQVRPFFNESFNNLESRSKNILFSQPVFPLHVTL